VTVGGLTFKSYAGQTNVYANLGGLHTIFQKQGCHAILYVLLTYAVPDWSFRDSKPLRALVACEGKSVFFLIQINLGHSFGPYYVIRII